MQRAWTQFFIVSWAENINNNNPETKHLPELLNSDEHEHSTQYTHCDAYDCQLKMLVSDFFLNYDTSLMNNISTYLIVR